MGWGAFIGGISSAFQGYQDKKLAEQQMRFQSGQANTERLRADSAHQREVEDLKKAGLNPILSAGGGGAGAGAVPSGSQATAPDYASAITNSAKSFGWERKKVKAETEATRELAKLNSAKAKTQTSQTDINKNSAKILKSQVPQAEIKGSVWKGVKKWYQKSKKRFNNLKNKGRTK